MKSTFKFSNALALLTRFGKDRRGNFGIIFGMALLPMLGFVGMAIDYTRATEVKNSLNAAADAAALAAVAQSRSTKLPADPSHVWGIMNGASRDSQFINASASVKNPNGNPTTAAMPAGGGGGACVAPSTPGAVPFDFTQCMQANSSTAQVQYTAEVPTIFMQVLGFHTMQVTGTATAKSTFATYLNFFMVLDNSPSMGLAGSPTDLANMQTATTGLKDPQSGGTDSMGCAFACHVMPGNLPKGVTEDYYKVAKDNNILTRIDYMKSAVTSLLNTANTYTQIPNQFQFGLYSFNTPCTLSPSDCTTYNEGTAEVAPLQPVNAANLPNMVNAVDGIDLAYTLPGNPDDQTDIDGGLTYVKGKIPSTYTTPSPPSNFVVLVSDGLQDKVDNSNCRNKKPAYAWPGGCRHIATVTQSVCQAIKATGAQVAVVYTPYLYISQAEDSWTYTHVDPMTTTDANGNSIDSTALQSCASSPGLFVATGPGISIGDALNTIFKNALAQTVLTK
ncbi:MAG: hypothetical protein KGQ46_07830 [Hyphomicrobiales bacterium]|nr:hypothetical protein [Hyphomicrobiales bacterium]MDE2114162.1 hypothetical protein [Hyphomicrobiales bacterium]